MIKFQRIIEQSTPVTFITDKSKHTVLPGFHGVPLYDAFNFFIAQLKNRDLTEERNLFLLILLWQYLPY